MNVEKIPGAVIREHHFVKLVDRHHWISKIVKNFRELVALVGDALAGQLAVFGGIVGLVIDCRGRPFNLPENKGKRMEKLNEWFTAMNLYPET